ncbi:MAG: SET domain-containing protein-lysine N-methyltransferase [Chthoniobacterales bacterium]
MKRATTATTHPLVVKKSGINGKGCFAAATLSARRKVGEFTGERISNREAARRVARGGKVMICEVGNGWSIDASRGGDATAFINHSCTPNCFSRITHGRLLFFALREIQPGEELTLDYTPSQHPGLPCTCGAPSCRGVMS